MRPIGSDVRVEPAMSRTTVITLLGILIFVLAHNRYGTRIIVRYGTRIICVSARHPDEGVHIKTATTSTDWFATAGFGVFVHFGHAARRGWELSWQMTGGVAGQLPLRPAVSCEEYFANASEFNPGNFDADAWADAIAASGAAYAVFTSKHHDGFAMFDTEYSDYSIVKTSPFGRDLMAELLTALRARHVRIGLYFSLPDWHHPEYPTMTDETATKPFKIGGYVRTSPEQWARYRDFMLDQLTEILTKYGVIDILWLDGIFDHTLEEWDFAQLRDHIRDPAAGLSRE